MWQQVLVAVAVAASGVWVVWTLLLPRAVTDRLRRLAGRGAPAAGACGGCRGCGSDVAAKRRR